MNDSNMNNQTVNPGIGTNNMMPNGAPTASIGQPIPLTPESPLAQPTSTPASETPASTMNAETSNPAATDVNANATQGTTNGTTTNDGKNGVRFALTFFLGWIGSLIINHTSLKPQGWKCNTGKYFFLTLLTLGIYALVASFSNLGFNPNKDKNIGYTREY